MTAELVQHIGFFVAVVASCTVGFCIVLACQDIHNRIREL